MRRHLIFLFLLLSVLCSGCSDKGDYKTPINLYYLDSELSLGENSVFSSEIREGSGNSVNDIVQLYLRGPMNPNLKSPFPDGTTLLSMTIDGEIATITLSDAYASLSGYQLTLSNICLAQTIWELTATKDIIIRCESLPLDGDAEINLTRSDIIDIDHSQGNSSQQAETNSPTIH